MTDVNGAFHQELETKLRTLSAPQPLEALTSPAPETAERASADEA